MQEGQTPLHKTADFGHLDLSTYLIAQGADINAADEVNIIYLLNLFYNRALVLSLSQNGETPLHKAAEDGNLPICQLLVDNGCEVSKQNKVSISIALTNIYCLTIKLVVPPRMGTLLCILPSERRVAKSAPF